jgi:uncharacterized protein (TIGR02588 family)
MAKAGATKAKTRSAEQRIEWWIGIASGVVTLALIGYLLFEAITGSGDGPLLRVVRGPVLDGQGHYVLQLRVSNEGDETASDVLVEGRLGTGEGSEVSSILIDYVPPGPGVPAALVFERDPRSEQLVLAVRGYRYP